MDHPLFVGIVGSRRRNTLHDRKIVLKLVDRLTGQHGRPTIVSGGCPQGADAFAEEAARIYGLDTVIFPIDKKGAGSKWEFTKRAYARNRQVARRSDSLYCLVHPDRTGGTENTIGHALDLGKQVYLVLEDGTVYLSRDGTIPTCAPEASLLD